MRHGAIGELIRFGISTGVSAVFTLGVPVLLHEGFGIGQKLAVAVSQSFALLLNFVMIRIFVFRSKRAARRDVSYYVASAITFRGLEYLFFLGLFGLLHLFYFLALVLTLSTSTLLKFVWYRFLFVQTAEPVV